MENNTDQLVKIVKKFFKSRNIHNFCIINFYLCRAIIIVELFVINLCVYQVKAEEIKYRSFRNYALKKFNTSIPHQRKIPCSAGEMECFAECSKDPLCSGISFKPQSKECIINRFARCVLNSDTGTDSWIKGMNYND